MNLEMVVTWVLVGLCTGWMGGMLMKAGGFGLLVDLILGVVGSSAAGSALWALGVSPEAGKLAIAAFVGAALLIVAQRKVYAHA